MSGALLPAGDAGAGGAPFAAGDASGAGGAALPARSPADGGAPPRWPGRDGSPIACREKLRVLEENRAELAQMMQDAFEDALLMGVDEAAMRALLEDMVRALHPPGHAV